MLEGEGSALAQVGTGHPATGRERVERRTRLQRGNGISCAGNSTRNFFGKIGGLYGHATSPVQVDAARTAERLGVLPVKSTAQERPGNPQRVFLLRCLTISSYPYIPGLSNTSPGRDRYPVKPSTTLQHPSNSASTYSLRGVIYCLVRGLFVPYSGVYLAVFRKYQNRIESVFGYYGGRSTKGRLKRKGNATNTQ